MSFDYFQGPEGDMAMLAGNRVCFLCEREGTTFSLEFAVCPPSFENGRRDQVGCVTCLRAGRFEFSHDTEIGADHGFLAYTRPYYRPEDAKLSWQRTISFLHRNL